jgi:hypothetical protein
MTKANKAESLAIVDEGKIGSSTINGTANFLMWVAGLVALAAIGSGTLALAKNPRHAEKSDWAITLRVYDYAHVNRSELLAAEDRATGILALAGVEAHWVDCPTSQGTLDNYPNCPLAWQENDLVMRVMPKAMVDIQTKAPDTLGSAIGCDSGPCSLAGVYSDRILSLSSGARAPAPILMGSVMAHEIGHMLLGPNAHSRTGIMRAFWADPDLSTAAGPELLFTPEQSRRMNARLAEQAHTWQTQAKVAQLGRQ